jgi:integrase
MAQKRTPTRGRRRPWSLRAKQQAIFVRFSHRGERYEITTRTTDHQTAEVEAASIFADVIAGRWKKPSRSTGEPESSFEEAAAEWLAAIEDCVDVTTFDSYALYVRTHFKPYFGTLRGLTAERCASYGRHRLGKVKRPTVQKELGALRGFIAWLVEQNVILEAPLVPSLPRGATGTPFGKRRRGNATPITEDEAEAIIAALPEWSESRRITPFPVRARVRVAFETGLRPSTLSELSIPEHYKKGSDHFVVTKDIDKNRYGREVPLSDATRAALDSICPDEGVIFGKHDLRDQLRKAAEGILDEDRRARFTVYDLKHLRATLWASSGDLPATAYLMGWKRVTTANIYARPTARAAARLVHRSQTGGGSWGSLSERSPSPTPSISKPRRKPSAKERTRTSTGVTPLPPQGSASAIPPPSLMVRKKRNRGRETRRESSVVKSWLPSRLYRPPSPTQSRAGLTQLKRSRARRPVRRSQRACGPSELPTPPRKPLRRGRCPI